MTLQDNDLGFQSSGNTNLRNSNLKKTSSKSPNVAATENTPPAAKVILFLDHTAKMGGGEIALLNLVCALDRARYRPVVVLASDGPLAGKLREAGVETEVVPLETAVLETRKDSLSLASLLRATEVLACARYVFRTAGLARRLGADIIHTNSLKSDLYGGLAGRLARIPVIWHVRDRIDSHYLPPMVAAAFRCLSFLIPQVVIANSKSTLGTLRLPPRKWTAVIYSGVAGRQAPVDQAPKDDLVFTLAHPPGTGAITATISLVGRIAEWKGQHIFIEAAAEVCKFYPNARFQIVGSPLFGEEDYELSLRESVRALGLTEQVEFLGFREDVSLLLAAADIVVHASTLGEPFGQVIIQGMAAGKPVVATDGGASREIMIPGVTGLLVPMGDAPAMAQAIIRMLADPALAERMGIAGQQRVQERFLISSTVRRIQSVYDHILTGT